MPSLRLGENPNSTAFLGGTGDDLLAKRSAPSASTTEEESSADRLRRLHEEAQRAVNALDAELKRQLVLQGLVPDQCAPWVGTTLRSGESVEIDLPEERHRLTIGECGAFQ